MLDVVPTLLDYAGVKPPPNRHAPLGGRDIARLFAGKSTLIHPPTEPIGYEAGGGAALYLGNYKLVRNVPPCGNRKWRLYDLAVDPTETDDMIGAQPQLAQKMLADCAAYTKNNGVVEVPPDYDVMKQGQANAAKK